MIVPPPKGKKTIQKENVQLRAEIDRHDCLY
jgi:hypothetical protein